LLKIRDISNLGIIFELFIHKQLLYLDACRSFD